MSGIENRTRGISFVDLAAQRQRIGQSVDAAVLAVLKSCQFVSGREVAVLENRLAARAGVKHAISCSSGTDALALVLMAKGVKPGDAVFCPSFTFAATAEVIALLGATPVFVDIDPVSFNLDAASLRAGFETTRRLGLRPVGAIAVDLFGQPADYDALLALTDAKGIWLLADAAQSFGAKYKDRVVGRCTFATATSFYPTKPLGCYGDGGAVFTDDDALAEIISSLRVHGQGQDKYDNVRIGMTGRLDTIQAAVLLTKLDVFDDELASRNRIAEHFSAGLSKCVGVPLISAGNSSSWAQYTVRVPAGSRERILQTLGAAGIGTAIYYSRPLHRQTAYRDYPVVDGGLPHTDLAANEVFSLPMHPYLEPADQDKIVEVVLKATRAVNS